MSWTCNHPSLWREKKGFTSAVFVNTLNEERTVPAWPPSLPSGALSPSVLHQVTLGLATPPLAGGIAPRCRSQGGRGQACPCTAPGEGQEPGRGQRLVHGEGQGQLFPHLAEAAHVNGAAPFPTS